MKFAALLLFLIIPLAAAQSCIDDGVCTPEEHSLGNCSDCQAEPVMPSPKTPGNAEAKEPGLFSIDWLTMPFLFGVFLLLIIPVFLLLAIIGTILSLTKKEKKEKSS